MIPGIIFLLAMVKVFLMGLVHGEIVLFASKIWKRLKTQLFKNTSDFVDYKGYYLISPLIHTYGQGATLFRKFKIWICRIDLYVPEKKAHALVMNTNRTIKAIA